jgi:hypothetical protein
VVFYLIESVLLHNTKNVYYNFKKVRVNAIARRKIKILFKISFLARNATLKILQIFIFFKNRKPSLSVPWGISGLNIVGTKRAQNNPGWVIKCLIPSS